MGDDHVFDELIEKISNAEEASVGVVTEITDLVAEKNGWIGKNKPSANAGVVCTSKG